jgi:hypothetical protein
MIHDARRLVIRLTLFSLPFLIYAGVIASIDPYNLMRTSSMIDQDLKMGTSFKLNYALWKILAYRHDPASHIILGDSRVMGFEPEEVSSRTGRPVSNLAYGGGSLQEVIDTFWLVSDTTKLERVSIGVGFNLYNAANDKNRVKEVRSILDNRLLYFTNLNVIAASGQILRSVITGKAPTVGTPPMSPDEFWHYQLDVVTRLYYETWRSPQKYRTELQEIADYCQEKNIELEFIIPPGHADLQETVTRFGLSEEYKAFKSSLGGMAQVYDFDEINSFTSDRDHFRDPYHLTEDTKLQVIDGIWGQGSKFMHQYGPTTDGAQVPVLNGE